MKSFISLTALLCFACSMASAQSKNLDENKIIVDNDQLKVTEYSARTNGDVCGAGIHSHAPHLTVLFTDADVTLTVDGKAKHVKLPSGTTFWSEAETHTAVNAAEKPIRLLIIEPK